MLPLLSFLCFFSACSNVSDSYFSTLHGGHRAEATLCLRQHGLSYHALGPVQPVHYSVDMAKVDKHICNIHIVATGAQRLLSTHVFCRMLACGGRHGAQPREHRSACTGHIKGGVRGGSRGGGPTSSVCLSGWDC